MGTAAIKIKLMPTSPDVNLDEIAEKAKQKVDELGGKAHNSEFQDVAFGLKAIIITLAWPEEKDTSNLENALAEIENVNSAQIIDYRREFG